MVCGFDIHPTRAVVAQYVDAVADMRDETTVRETVEGFEYCLACLSSETADDVASQREALAPVQTTYPSVADSNAADVVRVIVQPKTRRLLAAGKYSRRARANAARENVAATRTTAAKDAAVLTPNYLVVYAHERESEPMLVRASSPAEALTKAQAFITSTRGTHAKAIWFEVSEISVIL
jgi:hypothetical protein